MEKFKLEWNWRVARSYALIIIGSCILGFSLNVFFEPCNLVAGGITGLSIIIKELGARVGIDVPLWLSNLVLNIPLFIGAYFLNGQKFILRTAVATLTLSFALYISQNWGYDSGELLINAVYGGVTGGIGIGLVLTASATTGGTDLLAAIIHYFCRHLSTAMLLFACDFVIMVLSVLVFGMNLALYALIGVFLNSWIADRLVDGFNYSKALFIISDHSEEISSRLMQELDRGVTGIPVYGKYTGKQREMLLVVTSLRQAANAKRIVREIDPNAFLIVTDSNEVLGEGFADHDRL